MNPNDVMWDKYGGGGITASLVFYRILKTTTLILAASIAPLAYLTRKPTVPAILGSAILVIEALQLIFHFRDDVQRIPHPPKRKVRQPYDMPEPTFGGGRTHFPQN